MGRMIININQDALDRITIEDPRMRLYVRELGEKFIALAIADFERQQHHDNEFLTSETTPPKYVESFEIEIWAEGSKLKYRFINRDPGAGWVEYGAHAGGKTFVLRYKPMTHALEAMSGEVVP